MATIDSDLKKTDEAAEVSQTNGLVALTISIDLANVEPIEPKITTANPATKDVDILIADRYLTKLFTKIILVAVLALVFIWTIDPYGVSPFQISLKGINTYKPKRLGIDRLIKPYEVWRYQPRTVFLGTSRIHESIDPSVFDGTSFAPAYNAAIPASTLVENAEYIEQFLKLDPKIEHIFIELFIYNFTIQDQELTPKKWNQLLSNYASLQVSSNALIDAIHTIFANQKNGPVTAHIAKRGHWIPSSDFNPATTFSDTLYINTVRSLDRAAKFKLEPSALKSLDRIVGIARHHKVKLHMLLTPNYPWDDYRLMTLGYWPLLEDWMRKMATYSDVISFSQYNKFVEESPTLNPPMKWWNDPTHFSLNMGRAMMRTFLGNPVKGTPTNLMRHMTPATVESVIAERRAGVLHWAAMHPDFVADFEEAKTITDTVSGTLNASTKTLTVNNRKHPIVLGVGEVSFTEENRGNLSASGWAVDETAKRHVTQLIATVGSSVIAQGLATVKRKDIELGLGKSSIASGFNIVIPLQTVRSSESIRIFALMKNGRAVQLTSQSPRIDGVPISASLGTIQSNKLTINNMTYPIVNRIVGSIEGATPISNGYGVNGWVANIKANSRVSAIIAAVGNNIVSKGLPTVRRDDTPKGLPSKAKPLGFLMNVPLRSNQIHGKSQVQFFAIMDYGVAFPIASNLKEATNGL